MTTINQILQSGYNWQIADEAKKHASPELIVELERELAEARADYDAWKNTPPARRPGPRYSGLNLLYGVGDYPEEHRVGRIERAEAALWAMREALK